MLWTSVNRLDHQTRKALFILEESGSWVSPGPSSVQSVEPQSKKNQLATHAEDYILKSLIYLHQNIRSTVSSVQYVEQHQVNLLCFALEK